MKDSAKVFAVVFSIFVAILIISVFAWLTLFHSRTKIGKIFLWKGISSYGNNKITLYFTNLDEEKFALETTVHHHGSKTTTTKIPLKLKSTLGVTTSQHDHIPASLLGCSALQINFTKVSEIGDGICHDHLNHMHCNYDGGDCCLQNIDTSACSTCACLSDDICKLPQTNHAIKLEYNLLMISILVVEESCSNKWYIGDLQCEDENNHKNCLFDGGDCCLGSFGYYFLCGECICHTSNKTLS